MATTETIIKTEGLKMVFPAKGKSKTPVEAVRGISFAVATGEVFGLLGPNGAGKTTTMRMLSTLLIPTSGKATVVGLDLAHEQKEIRRRIGYVSQAGGMQREATGRENLLLAAQLYGINRADAEKKVSELLQVFGLEEFADRRTDTYSGGQRRIFDLASGIVHAPMLLFLDEPSTGLDPQNRARVWEQVKKLRDQGTTIFLTTHYLDEADALCDRVAIVDHGDIVAMGSPTDLKRDIGQDVASLGFDDESVLQHALSTLNSSTYIKEAQITDATVHLYMDKGDEHLPTLMRTLHEANVPIKTIRLSRPTLDDVFLRITGRSLEVGEEEAAR